MQCTACREYMHWSGACPYNFCTTCNNNSHATHMCRAPNPSPAICIYCASPNHRQTECHYRPRGNREQRQRPKPEALRNQQNQQTNTEISGSVCGNAPSIDINTGNSAPLGPRISSQGANTKILGNSAGNTSGERSNNQNN